LKRKNLRSTPSKNKAAEAVADPSTFPIDLDSQEQLYTAHRAADIQDAGYVNAEVEAYLQETRQQGP